MGMSWKIVAGSFRSYFPLTEVFAHGASARGKCKAPCSATLTRRRSPRLQLLEQPIDERSLPWLNLLACFGRREPRCAVDLRKGLFRAALRRPFHLEMVRGEPRRLEIAFDGKRGDHFATWLHDLAKFEKLVRRRRTAEFLLELALSGAKRIFALLVFALGDRPGASILLHPERAAGMHKQELELSRVAIHQKSRAPLGHAESL